jgi:hypothetical protein
MRTMTKLSLLLVRCYLLAGTPAQCAVRTWQSTPSTPLDGTFCELRVYVITGKWRTNSPNARPSLRASTATGVLSKLKTTPTPLSQGGDACRTLVRIVLLEYEPAGLVLLEYEPSRQSRAQPTTAQSQQSTLSRPPLLPRTYSKWLRRVPRSSNRASFCLQSMRFVTRSRSHQPTLCIC